MPAGTLHTWIKRHIAVRTGALSAFAWLSALCDGRDNEAFPQRGARFSGLHSSLFSKLLQSHAQVAITTLEHLSKRKPGSLPRRSNESTGCPWKIVILIDATLQHEQSHPENTKRSTTARGMSSVISGLRRPGFGDILIPLSRFPSIASANCRHMLSSIKASMRACGIPLARSTWKITLALTTGGRCWCWPIAATTI